MYKKILPLILGVGLIFASCAKDEKLDSSYNRNLQNKTWTLVAQKYNANVNDPTSTYTDEYSSLASCVKDNYYQFSDNNVAQLYEGATKCSLYANDVTNYNYTISAAEDYLFIYSTDGTNQTGVLFGKLKMPSVDTFTVEDLSDDGSSRIYTYKKN